MSPAHNKKIESDSQSAPKPPKIRRLPKALDRLKSMRRWVCWKFGSKKSNGKYPKIPLQVDGSNAKNNDHRTWNSYASVVEAARDSGWGIGFVLGDGVGAIDIDDCRDASTGELTDDAAAIVKRCNGAYVEATVSGKGLRVIGGVDGGPLPAGCKVIEEPTHVELYREQNRYITMSCDQISGDGGWHNIDGVIDDLAKRGRAAKGRKRRRDGDPDKSSSAKFHKRVCDMLDQGKTVDQIETDIETHPQWWRDTAASRYADKGRLLDEIERCDQNRTTETAEDDEPIIPVDLWDTFPPPELPRGVLPAVIENFAFELGDVMGSDPAGIAGAALAVCATAISDKIKLQPKRHDPNWTEPPLLWVAAVGDPSVMKTPALKAAIAPLARIDARLMKDYLEEVKEYESLSPAERKDTPPPRQERLRIEDTTIEGAQEVLRYNPRGVLCYQDELAGWFGSMDKYSGYRGSDRDRAFWLQAYNAMPYILDRSKAGRGSVYIPNLSIGVLGGIHPTTLRKFASESHDDGLIARLITIMMRPAVVGKDKSTGKAVTKYEALIKTLYRQGGDYMLEFDDDALGVREELERKHLELIGLESVNKKLASHLGKYNGLFARLCLIWHCVEDPDEEYVTKDIARRVARFMHEFLLPHALSFYAGVLGLSDDHDRLRAVAGYILSRSLERITNRDVQRGDRTMRGLNRADTDRIFQQLEAMGWLICEPGSHPNRPQWRVNLAVHEKFKQRAKAESERRARDREMILQLIQGRSRDNGDKS